MSEAIDVAERSPHQSPGAAASVIQEEAPQQNADSEQVGVETVTNEKVACVDGCDLCEVKGAGAFPESQQDLDVDCLLFDNATKLSNGEPIAIEDVPTVEDVERMLEHRKHQYSEFVSKLRSLTQQEQDAKQSKKRNIAELKEIRQQKEQLAESLASNGLFQRMSELGACQQVIKRKLRILFAMVYRLRAFQFPEE